MDRDSLLELLSKEDVIALMEELGSDWYKEENNSTLIFESICHGSTSHKLYYYLERIRHFIAIVVVVATIVYMI